MRLQDALAELKSRPAIHVMWRPGDIIAYAFEPDFNPEGLSLWYSVKHLEELRAGQELHDPLVGGVGPGVEVFSMADVESSEWRVTSADEARTVGYTDKTHDPATCSECARERAREHGNASN